MMHDQAVLGEEKASKAKQGTQWRGLFPLFTS